MPDNSLTFKGEYTAHRRLTDDAGAIAPDPVGLGDGAGELLDTAGSNPNLWRSRACVNARGFDGLEGFVSFQGGTAPTVTLQPLELVEYVDEAGNVRRKFVSRVANTTALVEGGAFSVSTPGGGRWYMRVHAVTGAPVGVGIFLAGGDRAEEGSL